MLRIVAVDAKSAHILVHGRHEQGDRGDSPAVHGAGHGTCIHESLLMMHSTAHNDLMMFYIVNEGAKSAHILVYDRHEQRAIAQTNPPCMALATAHVYIS